MKAERIEENKIQFGCYRMHLHGAMLSPSFDWSGDISLSLGKDDHTVLVTLAVDQDSLQGFLKHFWSIDLSILPLDGNNDGLCWPAESEENIENDLQWPSDGSVLIDRLHLVAQEL